MQTGHRRGLLSRWAVWAAAAGLLVAAVAAGHAASNMTVKKDEAFQTGAAAALLLDPESDSVLYEKNGDQLVAPASLAKLMTLEFVFNEIKQGHIKLDDEFPISENAWRKGGAPSHGSTMFAAIHSRVKLDDLIHGIIVDSANDACIAVAEALAGNEPEFGAMLTKRAREIGLEKSTFTNATGYSDPESARHRARDGGAGAPHHEDLSRVLSVFRRARIHLEQHPATEPQSACWPWASAPTGSRPARPPRRASIWSDRRCRTDFA